MMGFCKQTPFYMDKIVTIDIKFWELYYSAPMTRRNLKFLFKVLEFLISIFNGLCVLNALWQKQGIL